MRFHSQSGRSAIWTPLLVVLGILIVYCIIQFAPIYVQAYQIEQTFQTIANQSAHLQEHELRLELRKSLEPMALPFDFSKIHVSRSGEKIVIDVAYEVEVKHPFLAPTTLHLHPRVEQVAQNL